MKSLLRRLPLGLLLLLLPLVPVSHALASDATVRLLGQFRSEKPKTCFRIQPVDGSFDVRDVTLSSIRLVFHDGSLSPLEGSARVQFDCEREDSLAEVEGDHGGCDSTGEHDAARIVLDGDHPRPGEGDDEGDDDCGDCAADSCNAVAIRVCFSTPDVISLFGDASLPDSLVAASVQFTLADGGTVVATFDNSHLAEHGHGEGDGDHRDMDAKASPNPLNPRTRLTFTLSRAGRVQVGVYDMQGRLVTKLLDDVRAVGPQSLTWDGSNSRNARVASGVYFFRIQAPEGQVIRRVAVVK